VRLTAEKVAHGEHPLAGGQQPKDKAISKAAQELGLGRMAVSRAVAAESLPEPIKAAADAAGLGTVARAEAARAPTAEAQAAKIDELRRAREAKAAEREEQRRAKVRHSGAPPPR
jgi:hypothetical protein